MGWTIEFTEVAAKKFRQIDTPIQKRIRNFLRDRLGTAKNPRTLGAKLQGNLGEFWKYRVGDWRLICEIRDTKIVIVVVDIGHRREVYR